MAKSIEIRGIGQVLFERSKRARHLNISVKPFRGIRIAVPYSVSFKEAEKIVYSQIRWIQKQLDRMSELEQKHKAFSKNSTKIDRTEARKRLVGRLKKLSELHGFTYNKVFIRNQKTRWGSCSAENNISLNMKLLVLPEELIDYVILHELVHTRIKNHTKDFWMKLDGILGNAKTLNSILNEYNMAL